MNPLFARKYKGFYPFRLATTSFIYADTYAANVIKTGPYFDEIELLFFESPSPETGQLKDEIAELARLALAVGVSYNIHLPIDANICDPDPYRRDAAISSIRSVIELTAQLSPTSFTLHVPFQAWADDRERIKYWLDHAHQGMTKLLKTGIPSRRLALENLDYPIEWLEPIITEFNLSICLDIGHLIINQYPILATYQHFAERICLIHLHGAREKRDHLSLDKLADHQLHELINLLSGYTQTVSIEVFNLNNLMASLRVLDEHVDSLLKPS